MRITLPTDSHPRRRRRSVLAAGLLLAAAGLTACAEGPADTPSPATATSIPAPTKTAEAQSPEPKGTEPSPRSDDGRPTAAPGVVVDAGTIGDGVTAEVSGAGDATVTFVRKGDFAVVAAVDCTACTGTAVLTGPGRGTPWGEHFAGLEAGYLLQWGHTTLEEEVWIAADGPWSMHLQSWNDLEPVWGEQSGSGPAVLFFYDSAPAMHVRYEPADADDQLIARYMGTEEGEAVMFGDSAPIDEPVEMALPGVLTVNTRGDWTLTPLP